VTLRDALRAAATTATGAPYPLHLCCGFEPLHLATYCRAHLATRLRGASAAESRPVTLRTGLFGDLAGNVQRALAAPAAEPLAVIVEWADLDPRLGTREGYLPKLDHDIPDILTTAAARLHALGHQLATAAAGRRIVLAPMAASLPPWLPGLTGQSPAWELQLRHLVAGFLSHCAAAGVRVATPEFVPAAYDFRTHLQSGFPYSLAYTNALATALAALLLPPLPAKGLITDLDGTLWAGVVGDDGPDNVHWSLEQHARPHGLYQQLLAGLAAQGTLLGIASKNDPEPVAAALGRPDLLTPADAFFPVETNWGPKSESIRRIAAAWNVDPGSLVFVDDNELELAEVRQALPAVACLHFPTGNPTAVWTLLETVRGLFARETATAEDRLRAGSLRAAALHSPEPSANPETLLATLQAKVSVSLLREPFDPRALELLNKTNQFNLNGRRWEESDFRAFLQAPDSVLAVLSYEDRFGALGKIAVAAGVLSTDDHRLRLHSWVMSCRAFSRRIEFLTLRCLFDQLAVSAIELDWNPTPRNGPLREALTPLCGDMTHPGLLTVDRERFDSACPPLYATVS
jgi:FkbH-like protein